MTAQSGSSIAPCAPARAMFDDPFGLAVSFQVAAGPPSSVAVDGVASRVSRTAPVDMGWTIR